MKHFVSSFPQAHSFGALPAQPWWVRRRWQLVGVLLSLLLMLGVRAQASVIITVGTGGAYSTIETARAVPSPRPQP